MVGAWDFDASCASGTVPSPAPSLGFHCCAPAGLRVSSHSKPKRLSKKLLLHWTGLVVQAPSNPELIVSPPLPVPKEFRQPRPCSSKGAASGSRVTSGDQCDGLLVVHRHAAKGLANVLRGEEWVRVAVRTFGVDVDEAHLHRAQGIGEFAVTAIALVAQPGGLGSPVRALFGLPDVHSSPSESERREPHRLQSAVAREDHQVRPRDPLSGQLLSGANRCAPDPAPPRPSPIR